ncbi:MAG: S16 family serine protease [Candidatus Micrarchaeota archaeon]
MASNKRNAAGLPKKVFLAALLAVFILGFGLGFVAMLASPQAQQPQQSFPTICPKAECPVASPVPSLASLPEQTLSSTLRVLAVRSDTGQGAIGNVTVEIRPGKGRVLVNTNPFVEPDTQQSADTAARYAAAFTKKSIADRDVIYSFESPGQLVGGPSAGAAMTIATIAALEGKTPKRDVAMTGTIDSDGKIGFIGGVIEKADAAAADGVKLFLVPKGQEILQYYREREEQQQQGRFTVVRRYYVPVQLDVNNYTTGEYGMTTRGVATASEAAKAFFS